VKVIGFGTYDRSRHPRIGILLDGLGQLGEQVIELNAPLGFTTAERVAMLGKPWLGYRFLVRLLRRWTQLTFARFAGRGSVRPDAIVVGYLGHFDVVLARMLFPRTVIALDLLIFAADTAADRGVRTGPKLKLLGALDHLAIRCADLVVVDTEEHAALVPAKHRHKVVVAAVGSPDEWFASPPEQRPDGPLRVVFFGLFTPLQGAPVIGEAVSKLAAEAPLVVTMIGSGQDLAETRARVEANGSAPIAVDWRDWVEPDQLGALLRTQDICLGIFSTTPKGLRVTPNKVFQGAASGCAIITSDTAPQRRSLGDAAVYVPPGDSQALAETLTSLASDLDRVLEVRRRANRRAEAEFRPRQVAEPLLKALKVATSRKK
jgi:glycosyltransferase involved in cell wall biosynthesis